VLTKDRAKEAARRIVWRADRGTTADLRRRFLTLDPANVDRFRSHLLNSWSTRAYWESEVGRRDLDEHTVGRLIYDRHEYVPWLNALRRLDGARIFEIGCGTGSSIFSLREQGSEVTGIDVAPDSVEVSRARFRCFGLDEPPLHHLNATEIDTHFDHQSFDLVIFFASLEHMTFDERLHGLRAGWRLLADDGILCIIEAPNRLWLFDDHTADLPFFHWLPDEIALEYLQQTPGYQASPFDTTSADAKLELTRRGRGVSFHDIELALGPIDDLDFIADRQSFQMQQNQLRWLRYHQSSDHRYVNLLRRQRPDLPVGLFMQYLNIAIRKSGGV
jgi:2-polyprenyl-3-methyl-5-hydroxy-6-metoxy-1,4-benzoquinol methylase